jgi:hypothetical protein
MPMASCGASMPACEYNRCTMRDKRGALSAAECDALLAASNRDLEAKLAAADRSCKTDDDCTLTSGGCVSFCGGPAIAKRGEAAYKAEYASIAAACKKWSDRDCMETTAQPIPSCAPIRPQCKGGHCAATR